MEPFELFLFTARPHILEAVADADVAAVVVDWERRGKERRQEGADTQIGHDTVDDLRRVRETVSATVICRINPVGPGMADEIEAAIDGGADELLVPMAREPRELKAVFECAAGRCAVGMLLETPEAVAQRAGFAELPLRRVYFGLNDYAIALGHRSIFTSLADGTVERALSAFDIPRGVGGLTVPGHGSPIPVEWLMSEMVRLGCSFSFLRRSFLRDANLARLPHEIDRVHRALTAVREAGPASADTMGRKLRRQIERKAHDVR